MKYNFSKEVQEILKKDGWFPNRNVKKEIEIPLENYDYPLFVLEFLYEFGGLKIGESALGKNTQKVQIEFSPKYAKDQNEDDGDFRYYSDLIGKQIYPLGKMSDGYYLGIDCDNNIYCLRDYCTLVSNKLEKGLHNLLVGYQDKLIQLDENTGEWISEESEN